MLRIGQGFDLHRLVPDRPFKLGGVLIEWPKGPLGHSDGDVLLHAITDALLGAAGMGDIGEWFSPSDPRWQNADSADLLRRIHTEVAAAGWQITNLDTTILLEQPKLSPYKIRIRQEIAQILKLSTDQISIKAKTMEQLGPIGTGDATAAMATVLLQTL